MLAVSVKNSVERVERPEVTFYKLGNATTDRALLAMLYNTPLRFALDSKVLDEHGEQIAGLHKFFATLQNAAGTLPLTGFEWLTKDRLVQRTSYGGDALTVTANFGTSTYKGLPAGCVRLTGPDSTPNTSAYECSSRAILGLPGR